MSDYLLLFRVGACPGRTGQKQDMDAWTSWFTGWAPR